MIEALSQASLSTAALQQAAQRPQSAVNETASPFDIALQIQDVKTENVKRALDAQTLVLDLLA